MGNQQGTINLYELGWLVGIIDGEGTITIGKNAVYKGNYQYKPLLRIYNTDRRVIDFAIKCCQNLGLAHYIRESKSRYPKIGNYQYRPIFELIISGYKRIKSFFEIVKPELFINKSEQAKAIYQFVDSRLSREKGWQNKNFTYSEKELALVQKVYQLNSRGKGKRLLTDYTPSTDNTVKI